MAWRYGHIKALPFTDLKIVNSSFDHVAKAVVIDHVKNITLENVTFNGEMINIDSLLK